MRASRETKGKCRCDGRGGAPLESTLTETIHVISGWGNDDFRLRAVFHTTINANGDVTAVVESMDRVCD
jgi:hypothetical protein